MKLVTNLLINHTNNKNKDTAKHIISTSCNGVLYFEPEHNKMDM